MEDVGCLGWNVMFRFEMTAQWYFDVIKHNFLIRSTKKYAQCDEDCFNVMIVYQYVRHHTSKSMFLGLWQLPINK